jgi:hypothetical protein
MPALGWAISRALRLPTPYAVGLCLVACCPGGVASNVVTFLACADVPLSVCAPGGAGRAAPPPHPLPLAPLRVSVLSFLCFLSPEQSVAEQSDSCIWTETWGKVCMRNPHAGWHDASVCACKPAATAPRACWGHGRARAGA